MFLNDLKRSCVLNKYQADERGRRYLSCHSKSSQESEKRHISCFQKHRIIKEKNTNVEGKKRKNAEMSNLKRSISVRTEYHIKKHTTAIK